MSYDLADEKKAFDILKIFEKDKDTEEKMKIIKRRMDNSSNDVLFMINEFLVNYTNALPDILQDWHFKHIRENILEYSFKIKEKRIRRKVLKELNINLSR